MNKGVLIILLSSVILSGCNLSKSYHTIKGYAQGGTFHIIYSDIGDNGEIIPFSSEFIEEKLNQTLWQIDNSLSGYNPSSTISLFNHNKQFAQDSLFLNLFSISKELYQQTDGLFDISGAPLFDLWGFGFEKREAIHSRQIDSIRAFVGMEHLHLEGDSLIKDDPRVKINFNAIAQGYSCDLVAALLESLGIHNYLVEIGMEIMCKGLNSKGEGWNIGIDTPRDGSQVAGESLQEILSLSNVGIVTSGNYRKFYIDEGKKFSHTINPKSGYPVTHNLLSATIIAPTATIADAFATYCMVIGLEGAISFVEAQQDLEGYFIYGEQDNMKSYYTSGFSQYIKKQ